MRGGWLLASLGVIWSAAAIAQTTQYDGVYPPPPGLMGASCGSTVWRSALVVKDGKASIQTVSAGLLEGTVKPDGSLEIVFGANRLTGKITGTHFSGEASFAQRCHFTFEFDRR